MRRLVACLFMGSFLSANMVLGQCRMAEAFRHPNLNLGPSSSTSVWTDDRKASFLFMVGLHVNTDGTRRSYKVSDFWGKDDALNTPCNAMKDSCAGLTSDQLKDRRLLTERALASNWRSDLLTATKISSDIIPFKAGKPCPLVDGFLVSATALLKPNGSDVCDLSTYLDALNVPAVVIPKGANRFRQSGIAVGDLVVAIVPGATSPVFGVIGDTGPANKLGEASIAMNGQLLNKNNSPKNYDEIRGRPPFVGKGWDVPKAVILIFSNSRDKVNPYMQLDRIEPSASKLFENWGGLKRLNECAGTYK
ncbi:MAG TPA: hypothetical protein VGO43_10640 [Pyrinomonadaceae bacterium]|nr:hypothetical protein [Pyrinomonadaceae bacterium]